jgi:hypothetical protein
MRIAFQADYRYYGEPGLFDFPQGDFSTRLFNAVIVPLTRIPAFRKKLFDDMNSIWSGRSNRSSGRHNGPCAAERRTGPGNGDCTRALHRRDIRESAATSGGGWTKNLRGPENWAGRT